MMLLSTLLLALAPSVMGFSFNLQTDSLTQCGTASLTWSGGTPPFTLTVIPTFDYPSNVTVPDSAYSDGEGSWQWQVNYPADVQLVLMMGDATGISAGGVSDLYQVGAGNGDCSMRSTQADFEFALNETSVSQCQPVLVYWPQTAVAPVRIIGVIPHGQVFEITSADASLSRAWRTNIAAGTQFMLAAFDNGRSGTGGSSGLYTVGESSDSSCLDASSPSSTSAAPSSTGDLSGSGTPTRTGDGGGGGIKTVTAIATAPSEGLGKGTIAGIAVGSILAFGVILAVVLWLSYRCYFRQLILHSKELKEYKVKRGDVDLAYPGTGGSAESMIANDPNGAVHVPLSRRDSRTSHLRLARSRTTNADEMQYDETSVSPFWDGNRVSQSQSRYTLDVDLGPPLSASQSRGGASFPSSPDISSPYTDLPPSPLNSQGRAPYPPSSISDRYSRATGSGAGSMTKAQIASSFVTTNPDRRRSDTEPEFRSPPLAAPTGGFVREEDAGRVAPPASETEHLPPMYDPSWQAQDGDDRGHRR